MPWDSALNDLRDVLADLYPTEQDARQLAATAGLDRPGLIGFSATALNNWTNILTYALNNEQVDAVIRAARSQFPGNSKLAAAAQRWQDRRQQSVVHVAPGQGDADLAPEEWDRDRRIRFRELLIQSFDEQELRTLCDDIEVDYDSLTGQGKAGKARELIAYLERRGRLHMLVARCRKLRPHLSW